MGRSAGIKFPDSGGKYKTAWPLTAVTIDGVERRGKGEKDGNHESDPGGSVHDSGSKEMEFPALVFPPLSTPK